MSTAAPESHTDHPSRHYDRTCPACGAADLLRKQADEIEQLRLAEEGAKEAFGHVVQQKRDIEAECKRLRGLLDGAYETIRRSVATHNAGIHRAAEGRPVE